MEQNVFWSKLDRRIRWAAKWARWRPVSVFSLLPGELAAEPFTGWLRTQNARRGLFRELSIDGCFIKMCPKVRQLSGISFKDSSGRQLSGWKIYRFSAAAACLPIEMRQPTWAEPKVCLMQRIRRMWLVRIVARWQTNSLRRLITQQTVVLVRAQLANNPLVLCAHLIMSRIIRLCSICRPHSAELLFANEFRPVVFGF